jgi:hypothetical protein
MDGTGPYYRLPAAAERLRVLWGVHVSARRLETWIRTGRLEVLRTPSGLPLVSEDTLCCLAEEEAGDPADYRVA